MKVLLPRLFLVCLALIAGFAVVDELTVAATGPDTSEVGQWAYAATASSQYGDPDWGAIQATGPPDTPDCGDRWTAWAPLGQGPEPEYLEVYFGVPVRAIGLAIHETHNAGFVRQVDLIDIEDRHHTIWAGVDTTDCPGVLRLDWPDTPYLVRGARIHTSIDGWEEIDAVELLSRAGAASTLVVMNTDDSGPGSLRQCVEGAQPGDEILFAPRLDGQPIDLGGALVIDKDITITGRGTDRTIMRGGDHILDIRRGSHVLITGVTFWGGSRGAIHSGGNLTVRSCSIFTLWGHGIKASWRTTVVEDCAITGGLGLYQRGGSLTVRRSTVRGRFGAVLAWGGSCALIDSRITGRDGWDHYPEVSYGAVYAKEATLSVMNTTITGSFPNFGAIRAAGGIMAYRSDVTIEDSTIARNGGGFEHASGLASMASTITVRNTIVARSGPGRACKTYWGGIVASQGHNLDSDGSCGFNHPSDLPATAPMLGELQDNHGPTWTHVPLPGSPVLDRGLCNTATDQRGVPRPIDGNGDTLALCDIGAVEFFPPCDDPDAPYECNLRLPRPGGGFEIPDPESD